MGTVKLITHLHLVPGLRMLGAIPELPHTSYLISTWTLTLREEHRRRVFENRVLR